MSRIFSFNFLLLKLTYENWGFLQPNNYFGQDCVELEGDDGDWDDEDCDDLLNFICEKQVNITAITELTM